MLSASWRPKKICGEFPVQTPKPDNQGGQWCKSQVISEGLRTRNTDVQGQEKMDVPAQVESEFVLPPPFCFVQALHGLDGAHPHW